MMNLCANKSNGVNVIVKETQESELTPRDDSGTNQNAGKENILSEQDFEVAMTEAKELVNVLLEQNNTSETRKLKRRLWRIEKAWEALMRWIHSLNDSSSEEEIKKEDTDCVNPVNGYNGIRKRTTPFSKILLLGLPKQLQWSVLVEEIHHNVDCGKLTLHQLNRAFKKFESSITCADTEKENWVIRLPHFVGKRIIESKSVIVRNQVVSAKEIRTDQNHQCYKCWRFGHYGAQCQRATRCKFCAGFHHWNACTSKGWRCVNCTDKGLKEVDTLHIATDYQCPMNIL